MGIIDPFASAGAETEWTRFGKVDLSGETELIYTDVAYDHLRIVSNGLICSETSGQVARVQLSKDNGQSWLTSLYTHGEFISGSTYSYNSNSTLSGFELSFCTNEYINAGHGELLLSNFLSADAGDYVAGRGVWSGINLQVVTQKTYKQISSGGAFNALRVRISNGTMTGGRIELFGK